MNNEKITRFTKHMQAPPVRRVDINGNTFILLNSMALEGDGCDICREAENSLKQISLSLNCAKVCYGFVLKRTSEEPIPQSMYEVITEIMWKFLLL